MAIYHNGKQIDDLFHNGKKIDKIFHDGKCIYASKLASGTVLWTGSTNGSNPQVTLNYPLSRVRNGIIIYVDSLGSSNSGYFGSWGYSAYADTLSSNGKVPLSQLSTTSYYNAVPIVPDSGRATIVDDVDGTETATASAENNQFATVKIIDNLHLQFNLSVGFIATTDMRGSNSTSYWSDNAVVSRIEAY